MREKFLYWLTTYKELSSGKAKSIINSMDSLTELTGQSIFDYASFIPFAKCRQQIYKNKDLSSGVKKGLELYGDFLQYIQMAHIDFPAVQTSGGNDVEDTSVLLSEIKKLTDLVTGLKESEKRAQTLDLLRQINGLWKDSPTESGNNSVIEGFSSLKKDDSRSVGKLVKESMLELEKRGWRFTEENEKEFLSIEWSKKQFKLYYSFMRRIDENKSISEQSKDHAGVRRYWDMVFHYNGNAYIITSQWYDYSKSSFIDWFNHIVG